MKLKDEGFWWHVTHPKEAKEKLEKDTTELVEQWAKDIPASAMERFVEWSEGRNRVRFAFFLGWVATAIAVVVSDQVLRSQWEGMPWWASVLMYGLLALCGWHCMDSYHTWKWHKKLTERVIARAKELGRFE